VNVNVRAGVQAGIAADGNNMVRDVVYELACGMGCIELVWGECNQLNPSRGSDGWGYRYSQRGMTIVGKQYALMGAAIPAAAAAFTTRGSLAEGDY
jgi:hypothetical protein